MNHFIYLFLLLTAMCTCNDKSSYVPKKKIVTQDDKPYSELLTEMKESISSPTPQVIALVYPEVMPKYPAGDDALKTDIHKKIKLRSMRQLKGGTVVVRFVVKKDGSIGKVKIIKSIEGFENIYNEAITNAIKSLNTKFEPGLQAEKPIDVWYTLPLEFKMNNLGNQNHLNKPYSELLTEMKEDASNNDKDKLFWLDIEDGIPPEYLGGGNAGLRKEVQNKIKQANIQFEIGGTVVTRFVVKKDGNVGEVRVVRGISNCDKCSEVAINAIRNLDSKFKPGAKAGKPDSVSFILPLIFKPKE